MIIKEGKGEINKNTGTGKNTVKVGNNFFINARYPSRSQTRTPDHVCRFAKLQIDCHGRRLVLHNNLVKDVGTSRWPRPCVPRQQRQQQQLSMLGRSRCQCHQPTSCVGERDSDCEGSSEEQRGDFTVSYSEEWSSDPSKTWKPSCQRRTACP